jgi:hypothetical protein
VFTQSNLACYICDHIFRNERPVLLVAHEDGDWSFLCGGEDHSGNWCNAVGMGHLLERDPSLNECSDLPDSFEAERASIGGAWIRTAMRRRID